MEISKESRELLNKILDAEIPLPTWMENKNQLEFLAGMEWVGIYIEVVMQEGKFNFTKEELEYIIGLSAKGEDS